MKMQRDFLIVAIWGLSIAILAGGLAVYFAPPLLSLPRADEPVRGLLSPVSGLFGASQVVEPRLFKPSEVSLLGVLGQGEKGAVLVSISNGPVRKLSAGITEPDGWILHRVDPQQVVLGYSGQQITVSLGSLGQPLSR